MPCLVLLRSRTTAGSGADWNRRSSFSAANGAPKLVTVSRMTRSTCEVRMIQTETIV